MLNVPGETGILKSGIPWIFITIVLIMFAGVPLISAAERTAASDTGSQPIETGLVHWGRNFEEALNRSGREGKPVLALFQEVPGCSGTQQFGRDVLSHPLIIEAIENEFIPVLIYNNGHGKDAELLARYNEPAWNYQVIRFLNSSGRDIIPRKDHIWTLGDVAFRMGKALRAAGRSVPPYLEVLAKQRRILQP